MITPTILDLQSDEQRMRAPIKKLANFRKVVYKEMTCFKIMKLVYNKIIYTKSFNIKIIEFYYFKIIITSKMSFF